MQRYCPNPCSILNDLPVPHLPPVCPSNYEIGRGESFIQTDYYLLEQTVDDLLY